MNSMKPLMTLLGKAHKLYKVIMSHNCALKLLLQLQYFNGSQTGKNDKDSFFLKIVSFLKIVFQAAI